MKNLLRLLSGLAAWATGRWRGSAQIADDRTPSWYESTSLGEWCGSDTHCDACRADGDCDICDTINGRWMDAVAEYAQTCDGCGDLTENESLTMNRTTHLSYCRECSVCLRAKAERSPYRHGWYSVENDKALGHYRCTLASGGTVRVTNVTQKPTGGLTGWPDAVYMGKVTPPDEGGIERRLWATATHVCSSPGPQRFGKPWRSVSGCEADKRGTA